MTTTLYNGDCLEVMDKLISKGVKANFSFTSPPYNRKRNDKYNNYDDTKTEYYKLLTDGMNKMLKISNYVFLMYRKIIITKKMYSNSLEIIAKK